jgi:hypothetical protein
VPIGEADRTRDPDRPGARGVDDHLGVDLAAIGFDANHPAASVHDAPDRSARADANAAFPGGARVGAGELVGVDVVVVLHVRDAPAAGGIEPGNQLARVPRIDVLEIDSVLAQQAIHHGELRRALLARRDAHAADAAEPDRLAELRLQLGDRLARSAHQLQRLAMQPAARNQPGRTGGRARADVVAFEHDDVRLAGARQVPGDAAAEDAPADDGDGSALARGRAHGATSSATMLATSRGSKPSVASPQVSSTSRVDLV